MDKRVFRSLLIITLLSLAGSLVLYSQLPSLVPIHWNFYGEVDGWGPRWVAMFFMVFPLLALVGFRVLFKVDPRAQNSNKNIRAYNVIGAVVVIPLMMLGWLLYLSALGLPLPVAKLVPLVLGLLLIIMGNYMPQVQPNFFLGFRTPWALTSDIVWRKTQRMGGIAFCISGGLMLLAALLPFDILWELGILFMLLSLLGVYVYSYWVYRRLS